MPAVQRAGGGCKDRPTVCGGESLKLRQLRAALGIERGAGADGVDGMREQIFPHGLVDELALGVFAGRTLHAAEGWLAVGTRSLGERVQVYDLAADAVICELRGFAAAVVAPPLVVATGREGTVVLAV